MNLFSLIKEDWLTHDRDWTRPGFRAVVFCRYGQWRLTIQNRFLRAPLSIIYRALYRRARTIYGIELPYSVELGRRVVIEHQGAIVIHGNCKIGDDCIIRQGVSMGIKTVKHPHHAPTLGKRVDVGVGAKLIGNITIGDDAIIGANAVVTRDVPAGLTMVGIPARPISRSELNSHEY